jgi:3-(3-hydroxy-phenyl)propionate hydroxylase
MRVVLTEQELRTGGEPTITDVREALITVYGTDFGSHTPISISRFTDATRQAVSYRNGRVLLAGDAAHVHPPMGGQGLNIGVQDAVNLGWKLAQVVTGVSKDSLLDTYQAERHPVAARVLRYTMAHVALQRTDERTEALGDTVSEMLKIDQVRRHMAADLSGLDIRYGSGEGHPLIGRRMPNLDVDFGTETRRLFTLLYDARPLLLNLGEPNTIDIGRWADRVRTVDAKCSEHWEIPVVGAVTAPNAVLIRPDGYVAWAGDPTAHELTDALGFWFGPAIG